jgi:hypothetical protein
VEKERALNVEGYEVPVNLANATTCRHSNREVKNNSVYCNRLDQWVSVNYCAHACQKYEAKK